MIPSGISKVTRIVGNGKGGPNKDSIPVREDLNGGVIGYLKNGTVVRIVDPTYPGINKYRRLSNGSTWVVFEDAAGKLFAGQDDVWCEENSHLFEPEPAPPSPEEVLEYEVLAELWQTGGKRFLKLKKI